jgi:hypothetical protein
MDDSSINNKISIAIDASRIRSGGAVAHLIGILENINPNHNNHIHIYSYKKLLDKLPNDKNFKKQYEFLLEKSIFFQLIWQILILPYKLKKNKIDIVLYLDASAIIKFKPSVVMSQDMLSFEKDEINRFGLTIQSFRIFLIKYLQIKSFKRADGVIFLTNYASKVIQSNFTGKLKSTIVINHGINKIFWNKDKINYDLKHKKISIR